MVTNYGQIYMMRELKELTHEQLQSLLPKTLLRNKGATVVTSERFHSLLLTAFMSVGPRCLVSKPKWSGQKWMVSFILQKTVLCC